MKRKETLSLGFFILTKVHGDGVNDVLCYARNAHCGVTPRRTGMTGASHSFQSCFQTFQCFRGDVDTKSKR